LPRSISIRCELGKSVNRSALYQPHLDGWLLVISFVTLPVLRRSPLPFRIVRIGYDGYRSVSRYAGKNAVALLFDRIEQPVRREAVTTLALPPHLLVRESCGAPLGRAR
jgi:hypothetical protein